MTSELAVIEWHPTPALELWLPYARDELCGLPRPWRKVLDILLMAGSIADDLETKLKNLVLGATAYTAPTPVFIGLWGAAASISDASTGGTAGEISGGAYDRISVTNNTTNWPAVTANVNKKNGVDLSFPQATANWNAGANINQAGLLDANAKTAADNMMLWGDLTTPKAVLLGDTAKFLTNDFQWSLD